MKKIINIILALVVSVFTTLPVTAQIIESRSSKIKVYEEPKKPKVSHGHEWFVKAGGGVAMDAGSPDNVYGTYNVAFGYNKFFTDHGLYWGAKIGSNLTWDDDSDKTGKDEYDSYAHVYLGPQLGILRPLGGSWKFDANIGASFVATILGVMPELDLGFRRGAFLIGLAAQYAIIPDYDYNLIFTLNVGFAF